MNACVESLDKSVIVFAPYANRGNLLVRIEESLQDKPVITANDELSEFSKSD